MASIGTRPSPRANEIEVSLFGPGFGECVVLHVGQGDWIIVDSCRDLDSHAPVAIAYLNQLGVNVDRSVRRVVATHWHDDHIDGIGQVFTEAGSAAFVCTGAFQHGDFKQLLQNYFGGAAATGGSGVNELHSVFAEVARRQQKAVSPALILASANTLIWERIGQLPASVRSLSPSTHDVLVGLGRIHSEQLFGQDELAGDCHLCTRMTCR